MVRPYRSEVGVAGRGRFAADHLPESQSGERARAPGISVAVDAERPYAWATACDIAIGKALQLASPARVHARLLHGFGAALVRESGAELRPARAGVVPAGGDGVQAGEYGRKRVEWIERRTLNIERSTSGEQEIATWSSWKVMVV